MATDRLGTGFAVYLENTAGGGVFTKLADVISGQFPTIARAEVNVTDAENTAEQYIAGLTNLGEVVFTIAYDGGDTVQEALQTEAEAGPTADGKALAIYHSGMDENWEFSGFITRFAPAEYRPGEHITATVAFRVNSITGPTSGAPATT